jgi:DNA-binding NtrC family response regulator
MKTKMQKEKERSHSPGSGRPRLLLVSDCANWRQTFKATLGLEQFEISEASSVEEAILAGGGGVDLAVVDISTENLVGVLEMLRAQAWGEGIPILVDTVWLPNEQNLVKAGALPRYRAMPCTQREILRLVRQYLHLEEDVGKPTGLL